MKTLTFKLLATVLGFSLFGMRPAFADCFELYGNQKGLMPDLLRAIALTESSGNPKAVAGPAGSQDLGLMQINSQWLSKWNLTRKDLLNNVCLNIDVASRILQDNFQRYSNPWEAVGAYNAGCSRLKGRDCTEARQRYAWKVYRHLQSMTDEKRQKLRAIAS